MGISKELPDQCDSDNSLRMKLLQSLRFSLLPPMNAWLQEVLTMTNIVKTVGFQDYCRTGKEEMVLQQGKMPDHCFFCCVAFISPINAP